MTTLEGDSLEGEHVAATSRYSFVITVQVGYAAYERHAKLSISQDTMLTSQEVACKITFDATNPEKGPDWAAVTPDGHFMFESAVKQWRSID